MPRIVLSLLLYGCDENRTTYGVAPGSFESKNQAEDQIFFKNKPLMTRALQPLSLESESQRFGKRSKITWHESEIELMVKIGKKLIEI
jgi:hypothetical protein